MSSPAVLNKKTFHQDNMLSMVLADERGNAREVFADVTSGDSVPTEFELLKVGMWRTPYHGDIMIMPEDITAYIDNYKAGIGVSGNNKLKLPINYAHESWEKAAGWFVPAASADGLTLMATEVDWTPAAAQALIDGEWKCISAEFCPAGRGGWIDPLDDDNCVENVLTGAALTNIPLFSILEPVMASAIAANDDKPKISLLIASEHKETKHMPTLEDVLAKDNDALTDEERTLLVENKDNLSAEDRTKFGFEVVTKTDPVVEEDKVTEVAPELAEVAASIKSGEKMVVDSKVWASTQKQVADLTRQQFKADVLTHVARGAIKSDQADKWTEKIMADSSMKEILEDLPSNDIMASTQGTDKDAGDVAELETTLHNAIVASRAETAKKGEIAASYASVRASLIASDDRFVSLKTNQE